MGIRGLVIRSTNSMVPRRQVADAPAHLKPSAPGLHYDEFSPATRAGDINSGPITSPTAALRLDRDDRAAGDGVSLRAGAAEGEFDLAWNMQVRTRS